MEDGNNLDAFVQAAFLFPLPEALKALENAEAKGREGLKQRLGATCFDDGSKEVGKFYSILETHPYMRILVQAQVRLYFEAGLFGKSSDTMIDMLRLCPGDNMAQRTWHGSMLLSAGRTVDALSFVKQWLAHNRRQTPPRGGPYFKHLLQLPIIRAQTSIILHTAALACFRLWGDCPVDRQYLQLAARANPTILTKILAKIDKPRSLNNNPRGFNSPEEAQDYLWLTENLCSNVNCDTIEQLQAVYCTQECQKSDWKAHKHSESQPISCFARPCKQQKQIKDMVRAYQKGKPIPPTEYNESKSTSRHAPATYATRPSSSRICDDDGSLERAPSASASWVFDKDSTEG
ncbi:hypothetical protein EV702DRAFT_1180046 [Suillus placidus]|uniref:Uncharacterized protein n=1 Tax=Suillus placidus TaxID=48579 RepID=A0A9P6ZTH4_9AGAM|nr:hypothetical protein EV702DRAFT_1180046 [Suillus placidus]